MLGIIYIYTDVGILYLLEHMRDFTLVDGCFIDHILPFSPSPWSNLLIN